MAYYVRYHLQTLSDTPGILYSVSDDFLPVWTTSKVEHPILDLAVSSMALAVFSQAQHSPTAALEASVRYQKLLQTTQRTISRLNGGNTDACLLAIWFMSRYEHAEHRPSYLNPRMPFVPQLRSFKHHDGALAILRSWVERLSRDRPMTDVIKHTRRGMIKSALLRNLAIPDWMLEGGNFAEIGIDFEYDRIIVQLANVRHRLSILLDGKNSSPFAFEKFASTAEELDIEAQNLDYALENWTSQLPRAWSFTQHKLSDTQLWPTPDFYSSIVLTYSSLAHAAVWNQYYATRMLINNTRLKILDVSHANSENCPYQRRTKCYCTLDIMANKLASSIPFCLKKIEVNKQPDVSLQQESIILAPNRDLRPYVACLAVWPLSIASGLRYLDLGQQLWFRSQLACLGKLVGARFFECADTNHWIEL